MIQGSLHNPRRGYSIGSTFGSTDTTASTDPSFNWVLRDTGTGTVPEAFIAVVGPTGEGRTYYIEVRPPEKPDLLKTTELHPALVAGRGLWTLPSPKALNKQWRNCKGYQDAPRIPCYRGSRSRT